MKPDWSSIWFGYSLMFTGLVGFDYVIAFIIVFYAAAIKEWYDNYYTPSLFSYGDFVWSMAGSGLAVVVFEIIKYLN